MNTFQMTTNTLAKAKYGSRTLSSPKRKKDLLRMKRVIGMKKTGKIQRCLSVWIIRIDQKRE